MNKKIKVIELLNLLAENKIKKGTRINYNNVIYKVDFPNLTGVYKENGGTSLYDNLFTSLDIIELNTEVEILEDEEEIDIQDIKIFEQPRDLSIWSNDTLSKNQRNIIEKVNKLVKAVKQLDKKIDKEE